MGFQILKAAPRWAEREVGFTGSAQIILGSAYGNSLFCVVGGSGSSTPQIATSPDTITWTQQTHPFTNNRVNSVVWSGSKFCATSTQTGLGGSQIATSTDGVTWTERTSAFGTDYINFVYYANGLFIAGGIDAELQTSTDGVTWTSRTLTGFNGSNADQPYGAAYGNSVYVVAGQHGTFANAAISTSSDGITWVSRANTLPDTMNAITYGNGLFVIVGSLGMIGTSPDGVTWTEQTSFTNNNLFCVGYGNGLFIAGDDNGGLYKSLDGVTWTRVVSGFWSGSAIDSVSFSSSNSLFLIGVQSGISDFDQSAGVAKIATSTDGVAG